MITAALILAWLGHPWAAALALGREHIIPCMFRALLDRIGITEQDAPAFHYYLKRHIHLDEDFHAPLSLRLLEALCDSRQERLDELVLDVTDPEPLPPGHALWSMPNVVITPHVSSRSPLTSKIASGASSGSSRSWFSKLPIRQMPMPCSLK